MTIRVISIKRGDTRPTLAQTFLAPDGVEFPDPATLSAEHVVRTRGETGDGTILAGSVAISGSSQELTFVYTPDAADTVASGDFDSEFQVTDGDGERWTFPSTDRDGNPEYMIFRVAPDLGGATGDGGDETEIPLASGFGASFGA